MSGIRGKNTKPELVIRKGLHALGFRFRLHDRTLPGKPDLVLSKYRAVILIHGCFWHGHDCHLFKWPSSRPDFWCKKIGKNKENDEKTMKNLKTEGWRILTIWECAIKGHTRKPLNGVITESAMWLAGRKKEAEIRGKE